MKLFGYAIILFLLLGLQACSWVEQFVIYNTSDKAIFVSYELDQNAKGFAIFHDQPNVYPLNSADDIVWGKEIDVHDGDPLPYKVSIAVPAHSALIFGSLHNSTYKSYDQAFINEREFNLHKLQILYNNISLDIIPSTFDQHFKKCKGIIRFLVE